jgi:hypothetical protein
MKDLTEFMIAVWIGYMIILMLLSIPDKLNKLLEREKE